jgi:hypothetical protein
VEFGRKGRDRSSSRSSSDSEEERRGSSRDYPAKDNTEEWVEYTGKVPITKCHLAIRNLCVSVRVKLFE